MRIQKTLEDADFKLDSVITNIIGVSGCKILEAVIAGEDRPATLARLADSASKARNASLCGRVTKKHRFLLKLGQMDALDATIAELDREV